MARVEQSGSVALAMLLIRFVLDRVNISIASLNCRLIEGHLVLQTNYAHCKDRSCDGHRALQESGSGTF